MNETHGQIRANVSVDDGHPAPINVTVYQAQTIAGTKYNSHGEIISFIGYCCIDETFEQQNWIQPLDKLLLIL